MTDTTGGLSDNTYTELLKQISSNTTNDVIKFVIVIVVMIAIFSPIVIYIIRLINRTVHDNRENNIEEKKTLIGVIERNTEAITDLKGVVNVNNTSISTMLTHIDQNTSNTNIAITKIANDEVILFKKVDKLLTTTEDTNNTVHSISNSIGK